MDTPTTLILIRHGETIWNLESRWQGHQDSELTPLGLQQVRAVAERMTGVGFDTLYTSDLPRARRMAEAIAAATGKVPIPDPALRERRLGIFEGLTVPEIRERHPADYDRFFSRDPQYVIPQGESIEARHDRIVDALERIVREHAGQRIVVVTHGGVLDSAFRLTCGLPLTAPRRWVLYNGSLSLIRRENDVWMLETWGDVSHLSRTGTLDDY